MMLARLRQASRVADGLWRAALSLAVLALVLLVWPASADVPVLPASPRVRDVPPTVTAPAPAPVRAEAVVRVDPFSVGRAAPRTRRTPPAADTLPPGLAPDPVAAAALGTAADEVVERPRFFGTVTDAAGPAALLRFPGAAASELYREGARARGWRVVRVESTRAIVASPEGARLTLRLSSNPTP